MFRLFSSIRQSLLSGNNTVKYLKYAVGEFLLIVAGILVALQIQNWNAERQLEQDRQELIENLKADFRVNLQRIEEELQDAEERFVGLIRLLENSGGEATEMSVDELKRLTFNLIPTNEFEPVLGAYRSALSTGIITMIGDRDLQTYFIEFESRIKRLDDLDLMWVESDFSGLIQRLRTRLGSFNVLRGVNSYVPKNFQISDEEFYELMGTKDVYAFFETKRSLKGRQRLNLARIKEKTEQILAALEALD